MAILNEDCRRAEVYTIRGDLSIIDLSTVVDVN